MYVLMANEGTYPVRPNYFAQSWASKWFSSPTRTQSIEQSHFGDQRMVYLKMKFLSSVVNSQDDELLPPSTIG